MQKAQNYRDIQIQTASPGKLILLLYEGAMKFVRLAIQKNTEQDIEGTHNYIIKTQSIVTELNIVLDMEKGGEIATNLRMLYDFISRHLVQANVEKDSEKLQQVLDLLTELYEGWKAVVGKEEARDGDAALRKVNFTG